MKDSAVKKLRLGKHAKTKRFIYLYIYVNTYCYTMTEFFLLVLDLFEIEFFLSKVNLTLTSIEVFINYKNKDKSVTILNYFDLFLCRKQNKQGKLN